MFFPGSDHCSIPDPGGKKAPDPGFAYPGSGSDHCSIPDPGGKKAPDPVSGSATLQEVNTFFKECRESISMAIVTN
jgi:hypothetical protein